MRGHAGSPGTRFGAVFNVMKEKGIKKPPDSAGGFSGNLGSAQTTHPSRSASGLRCQKK
ncbi:hypothetical protein PAMC26510_27115 [Caballeronia sordidicola]|uniref:Uncharacterized protein n=1 Tax=Caballeronia sordidicola TaxID=196367 RepID=A0A242MDN0_CABSO|nr:hypothetical protein PAMC26510_27115 [Caballeronia sordidicola]